jgi:hypothetical protein
MGEAEEDEMPRKGLKKPYTPKKEYIYTIQDIAELAGTTRNALGVAKVRGKIDPGDFRSVVNFLIKIIIEKRLSEDLFASTAKTRRSLKKTKSILPVPGKGARKATGR